MASRSRSSKKKKGVPPGKTRTASRRRRSEQSVSTTMRLRKSVRDGLEVWAQRGRRSVSDVAQEMIEEALRMRDCPGIYFASEPGGRTAKIGGTGLAVWEVLRDFVHDGTLEHVREAFPQLSQTQLTAALIYFERHAEDVRREVTANATLTPRALEQRFPGLIRTVTPG